MSAMAKDVLAELDSRSWKYRKELSNDISKIFLEFDLGNNVSCTVAVVVKETGRTIAVYVLYHREKIPVAKRDVVAEMITRVNMKLNVGHFEMDLHDGDLRFCVSVAYGKAKSYRAIFKDQLLFAIQVPGQYFQMVERAVNGNMTAREALGEVQRPSPSASISRDEMIQMLAQLLVNR